MPCPPSFGRAADRGEITMEWNMEPIAPPSVVQEILASLAPRRDDDKGSGGVLKSGTVIKIFSPTEKRFGMYHYQEHNYG